jgi:hypothetical protein
MFDKMKCKQSYDNYVVSHEWSCYAAGDMDAPEWMQHTDDTVLAVWTDIEAAIKQQW